MKRLILLSLCLAAGIGIGWYFGYTRPALQAMHMYQNVKKITGGSDAEVLRMLPESLAAIKREDESVAIVALRATEIVNRGDPEAVMKYLAYWIGSYYRVYRNSGDTNLVARIERAAQ